MVALMFWGTLDKQPGSQVSLQGAKSWIPHTIRVSGLGSWVPTQRWVPGPGSQVPLGSQSIPCNICNTKVFMICFSLQAELVTQDRQTNDRLLKNKHSAFPNSFLPVTIIKWTDFEQFE